MIGLLTINRHRWYRSRGIEIAVRIDNVDVTDRCVAADDRYNWAVLYRLDASGRKFIEHASVAIELIANARVEFTWPQKDGASHG